MLDRAERKTPRQSAAVERRFKRAIQRVKQRWGRKFRERMLWRMRTTRANRHPQGALGAMVDELRRAL